MWNFAPESFLFFNEGVPVTDARDTTDSIDVAISIEDVEWSQAQESGTVGLPERSFELFFQQIDEYDISRTDISFTVQAPDIAEQMDVRVDIYVPGVSHSLDALFRIANSFSQEYDTRFLIASSDSSSSDIRAIVQAPEVAAYLDTRYRIANSFSQAYQIYLEIMAEESVTN